MKSILYSSKAFVWDRAFLVILNIYIFNVRKLINLTQNVPDKTFTEYDVMNELSSLSYLKHFYVT